MNSAMYSFKPACGQVEELALQPVAEEPPPGYVQELAHRLGQLGIDDRRPNADLVLGPKAESDPAAPNLDVALA